MSEARISVVIPAHDEGDVIVDVVRDLATVLDGLDGPDGTDRSSSGWEIVVVDDASTDATPVLLAELTPELPGLRVVRLDPNVGHGPALRTGWDAAESRSWIAHLDGDGEIPSDALAELWARRDEGDLLLGVRRQRYDGAVRRAVTGSLRIVARLAAGRPLKDANTPCKLVRAETLQRSLLQVPADAFAPSILLAVAVARQGGRIVEVPVDAVPRPHRRSWLVPRRLATGCVRSLWETARLAWHSRRS